MAAICGDYEILRFLGEGSFSKVFLARNKKKEYWALKITPVINITSLINLENEITLMKSFNHQNIIRLLDFNDDVSFITNSQNVTQVLYLALELANGGDLFSLIASTGRFTEDIARYFFLQIVDGISYLHENGVAHRDLKPENILINNDFTIKIADFGFSIRSIKWKTLKGTPGHAAPEIYLGGEYTGTSVDIFALGVILFLMVTCHPPFLEATLSDQRYKTLGANRSDIFWELHTKNKEGGMSFFSENFMELISMMLAYDPLERPSITEVMQHPWCKGTLLTKEEVIEEFELRSRKREEEDKISDSTPSSSTDPGVFNKNTIYRDITGKEVDYENEFERKPAIYISEYKRATQFFSTSDLQILFNTLALFASKATTEFEFSPDEYSVTLSYLADDEAKISMVVNILKLEDNDKYCIEAIKVSGDYFKFNSLFEQLKKFFGGHVNSTESD